MTISAWLRGPVRGWIGVYTPWSAVSWRVTVHVLTGGVIGVGAGTVLLTLAVLSAVLSVTVVFAVGTLVAFVACVHGFGALQRGRFEALLGERIVREQRSGLGLWAGLRDEGTWRQAAYHLFALIVGGVGAVAVAVAWAGGAVLVFAGISGAAGGTNGGGISGRVGLVLVGVVLVFAAPLVARSVAAVDLTVAQRLLGAGAQEALRRRLAEVERSRADLVAAADAERRRIERDLHDGMQQRLVALAMNLGMARVAFPEAPAELREALGRSHDDAKQALAELRGIVRGLHPAVLDDRGLDAALSGIVARSPVPAKLDVELAQRAPAAVEAVAYFVVAEALSNVAKHAEAGRVLVIVRLRGDRLHVVVRDDGRGGARIGDGSGLAQRVASVDGTLSVDSPVGGPTTISVELPCAS
ncbi:histidine kinase [Dactylosporangium sp. NPDC051541]|uniref:sensor histidine kinase n=1 Tax=Dactylosporangium sp. NPDC051541 TaxID=3363977 RepID=UPI0037B09A3B